MSNTFPGGVWPTMITPFTADGDVDYPALGRLVDWYIARGVSGLFAVCQSSEMFFMSLAERVAIARFVLDRAAGRVPVIASGHISSGLDSQVEEITAMAGTGVGAVILISNRLAHEHEGDDVWLRRLEALLARIPADIALGFYECPYPYKRVLSPSATEWCAKNGRFHFLKDTCCDLSMIRKKLAIVAGTPFKVYNANTSTLLPSLRAGATGYSGVMANFQPELYAWLCNHPDDPTAEALAEDLTICSLIERQGYPLNAKYNLYLENLGVEPVCRVVNGAHLGATFCEEIKMLRSLTARLNTRYLGT